MENQFRYVNYSLDASVTRDRFPSAIGVVQNYLLSRIPGSKESKSVAVPPNPRFSVIDLSSGFGFPVRTDPAVLRQGLEYFHQSQLNLSEKLRGVPSDATLLRSTYSEEFNITRGLRPANMALLNVASQGNTYSIGLKFKNHTGDDTRPLFWMQYDSLLKAAGSTEFAVDRGTLDEEITMFKSDASSYFRGNVKEAMSGFHPSELDLVLSFLWPEGLPEDVKRQLTP